jgi:hypothetical protein
MKVSLFLRVVVVLLLGLVILASVSTAVAQGPIQIFENGFLKSAGANDPASVRCEIQNKSGKAVTTVHVADYGKSNFYFLVYNEVGEHANTITVVVQPTFTGSPLASEAQVFTGYGGSLHTPFGIPTWGGKKTSGKWKLVVSNNLNHSATCYFNVVQP